jgi:biopolymer transport protein TolR
MKRNGISQKRDINAELNLTPFIDLLSTCVCFLLLSAVWVEVGSIEIKQSHGTAAAQEAKENFDLEVFFSSDHQANLYLKKNGKMVQTFKVSGEGSFEKFITNIDNTIVSKIINSNNVSRTIGTATVATADGLNYGHLVSTLDVLRKNKIMNIGVMSARN